MSGQDRSSSLKSTGARKYWPKILLALAGLGLAAVAALQRSAPPTTEARRGPTQAELCLAMIDKTCSLSLACPMTDAQREPLLGTFGKTIEECRAKLGARCATPEPLCPSGEYHTDTAQKCLEAFTSSTCESHPSEDSPEPAACAALCPKAG